MLEKTRLEATVVDSNLRCELYSKSPFERVKKWRNKKNRSFLPENQTSDFGKTEADCGKGRRQRLGFCYIFKFWVFYRQNKKSRADGN